MFKAFSLFMGIVFVGFGMGGIETASTWDDWWFSLLFSAVGLTMMWISVDNIKEEHK